jgi:hypothetical protein
LQTQRPEFKTPVPPKKKKKEKKENLPNLSTGIGSSPTTTHQLKE